MSIPPVGYPQAPKKGPGCWAIGGIGCLVAFIVIAVLIVTSIGSFMHSKSGRDFAKGFGDVLKTATAASACVPQMQAIQAAVVRYHQQNGTYPPTLKALVPTYLPDDVSLHCSVDPNTDPSHVTYEYFKPTETTPQTATLIQYSWQAVMTVSNETQTQTYIEKVSLGGVRSQSAGSMSLTPMTPSPGTTPTTAPPAPPPTH